MSIMLVVVAVQMLYLAKHLIQMQLVTPHVINHQIPGQDMGTTDTVDQPVGVEMNFPIVHQIPWDITRRCNYDCTYCWPSVHNNIEPHHEYEKIIETIDKAVGEWAEGDSIRWNFGGRTNNAPTVYGYP